MTDRASRIDRVVLFVGLAVVWAMPHGVTGDGAKRYETLDRLLSQGQVADPRYSLVGPLFGTPLWYIGHLVGDPLSATALLNVSLFTVFLFCAFRELRQVLPSDARWTTLMLLLLASMFPHHLLNFYGEVFTALAVSLGVLWLSRGEMVGGWTAVVLGGVNTPAAIAGVAAIGLRSAVRTRRPVHLALPVVVAGLVCLENLIERGSALAFGYVSDGGFRTVMPYSGIPGFSYPFVIGVLAILLSFGKGLIFFAPGLFMPLAKEASAQLRWIHGTLVWVVVGLILVYARWWAWYGGRFWGPRFFLLASVPASLALVSHLSWYSTAGRGGSAISEPADPASRAGWHPWLLTGVLIWSFWVGVNGVVFGQTGLEMCWNDHYALEALCHFTPEMSALFHPFVDLGSSLRGKSTSLAVVACAAWALVSVWVGRHLFPVLALDARTRIARALALWPRQVPGR